MVIRLSTDIRSFGTPEGFGAVFGSGFFATVFLFSFFLSFFFLLKITPFQTAIFTCLRRNPQGLLYSTGTPLHLLHATYCCDLLGYGLFFFVFGFFGLAHSRFRLPFIGSTITFRYITWISAFLILPLSYSCHWCTWEFLFPSPIFLIFCVLCVFDLAPKCAIINLYSLIRLSLQALLLRLLRTM